MQHTEVRHLRVADRALVAGAIVAPVGTPLGQVIRSQRCRVLPVQAVDDSPMRLSYAKHPSSFARPHCDVCSMRRLGK